MGLLDRLLAGPLFAGTPAADDDFWYRDTGLGTSAGMLIDEDAARKLSAWYRGRDLLSTALAMLPFHVYERLPEDQGAEVARSHPLYDVIHQKPCGWLNSFEWRRLAMGHLIDAGNHYARIVAGGRGFANEMQPFSDPRKVRPEQLSTTEIVYHVTQAGASVVTYGQDEILHLRGATDDGIVGKGVLQWVGKGVALRALPIVALTASGLSNVPGTVATLCKPIDLGVLIETVARHARDRAT